ncbi:hypothetical protein [Halorubrum tebenquichense]|uniref:hypothetical protein n=1 Tax=Halorubrum tebenquichense TaxID=119434 RepID=UPI001375C207|nr:hypothetical protein [Halorubrum tebenquichense]
MKRSLAIAAATIVVVSMLAMPLGAAVATAQSGPSGMVALGPDQVDEDLPSNADVPIRASDLEGNVYASDHAGTLQITVTTPERASDYMGENANVVADDDIAIVLADDEVHEGRDVAVDLGVLEAGVGYVPDVAYGVHDSGEEWQSPIEQEDGVGRFHVPEFSSNSVTFSGGITLSGNAAADGTNYQYELDNLNGVSDYAINLTGVTNSGWSNVSAGGVSDGDTISIDVGGNLDPIGPSSGEPTVTFTGDLKYYNQIDEYGDGNADGDAGFVGDNGAYNNPLKSSMEVTPKKDITLNSFKLHVGSVSGSDYGPTVEVRIASGQADETWGDGTQVATWEPDWTTGNQTVSLDSSETLQAGETYEFEFITDSENNNGEDDQLELSYDSDSSSVKFLRDYGQVADYETYPSLLLPNAESADPAIDIDGDGTDEASYSGTLTDGESVTRDLSQLSKSTDNADISLTSGAVDVDFKIKERTQTSDPVVEVNGYETEHNGVLSEGETTSLATNEAWLQEGTNNVTIRTNTPSNGPESLVDLEYSHDASGVTKSVDIEATSWTESFNVSHTFPSAVADADATLTFDEQVAEINDVEYRIDGGDWQAPPDYELNGTDLHVGLGDVEADTEIDVRATGHKVRAYDGSVRVTEPTVEGDDLSTEVEITDINPDGMFGLRVDETVLGDRLHYASEESWTGESAHAELTSSGTQILRAEDANEGSTMRVSTAPVSVSPESGAIEAEVEDGSEPTFSLRKGNTTGSDRIKVTYYDTVTGDRYALWSETREVEVDADRAESPVSFITDGSSETYSILQRDAGQQPPEDPPIGPTDQEGTLSLVLAFVGIGGVLVGSTFVSRKFNIGGWLLPVTATSLTAVAIQVLSPGSPLLRVAQLASESNAVTIGAVAALLIGMWQLDERTSGKVPWYVRGVIGVLSVVWALETISPGVILGGLRQGVESMGPLIVIVIVGGGAYLVREWIQARRAPDTVVEFSAGEQ